MVPSHAELQSQPGDTHLSAIAQALSPGSTARVVRRLTGGMDNGLHVIDLLEPGGDLRQVVLRRFGGEGNSPAEKATREWQVLKLLQDHGVSAPVPLLLDKSGTLAGSPAIVISYIDGKPLLRPHEASDWVCQVAQAIWQLQSVEISATRLDFLGPRKNIADVAEFELSKTERFDGHLLGASLQSAIQESITDVYDCQAVIAHDDFWPGNILWRNGQLRAIVDWNDAHLRDPATDVGYMWMDLTIVGESEAAEQFVQSYERLTIGSAPNMRMAKLLALARALPDPAYWMPSWIGSGRDDLHAADVHANFSEAVKSLV